MQTPAYGSWALKALPQSALNEHQLVNDAKTEIRSIKQAAKSARWKLFPTPAVDYQGTFVDNAERTL